MQRPAAPSVAARADFLRGIRNGLLMVAPFWAGVAWMLLRAL